MAVMKPDANYTPDHYFAALKLIEQLHRDGQIPAQMFRRILNDHAELVALSKFAIIDEREGAA